MEDEKNLDLSLGLPCGGGSSSVKVKLGSSSENTLDEGDRDRRLINEFKNFLEGGIQQPQKVEENAYTNYPKNVVEIESSKSSASGGAWMTNDSRSEAEIEKRSSLGEKRKNVSSESSQPKKHDRESSRSELPERTHISITTDEGSTAENEDVADSEVDGSTSRQTPQHEDMSKRFSASGSQPRAQKDIHVFGDRSGAENSGQKRFSMPSERELNVQNMPYGASFPTPGVNRVNISYSQPLKDFNSSSQAPLSSYPVPGMMHTMGAGNSDRAGIQSVMPGNFPLMFGYPAVQLPTLDKDNSRAPISHHQPNLPTYPGRNPINVDAQDDSRKLTQATMPGSSHRPSESPQYDGRAAEHGKSSGKQHVGEDGSSGYAQGEPKGDRPIHQVKDASQQHRSESFPSEFPAIRPGVAADLKFGGSGSYPNLPWVSTTGPGPNGKTISGVTYRYSPTQIRIVCACHGTHLSPEEFILHASEESGTRESGPPGMGSFPSSNPAASAQS